MAWYSGCDEHHILVGSPLLIFAEIQMNRSMIIDSPVRRCWREVRQFTVRTERGGRGRGRIWPARGQSEGENQPTVPAGHGSTTAPRKEKAATLKELQVERDF